MGLTMFKSKRNRNEKSGIYPVEYAYIWEKGPVKEINEDSIFVRSVNTSGGELVIACVCDGMGGIGNGEVASGYAVEKFEKWFLNELIPTIGRSTKKVVIIGKGIRIFRQVNEELFAHMKTKNVALGTTASMLILFQKNYYLFHIGDSRIYEISNRPFFNEKSGIRQLTRDHSINEHTLTRCLGLNASGTPDVSFGKIKSNGVYLLCSDGFRHIFSKKELSKILIPNQMTTEKIMKKRLFEIATRSIKKGERDNISAILLKMGNLKERG